MGLGRSKFPISFEEACQRAGDDVVNRLKDTFYRYSSNQWLLPQVTFLRDIFGDGMPPKLAEQLYEAFRGTQKGIKFNDLLRGLVLLVHGTQNEKIQLLTHMLMDDSGVIMRESLEKFIRSVDGEATNEDLETLFHKEVWCTSQEFSEWIKGHQGLSSFTLWLLSDSEQSNISLSAQADPPTYYQTLATKYGPGIRE
jgi:ubiquitin carboxyl-terminal hydrolase 6/32